MPSNTIDPNNTAHCPVQGACQTCGHATSSVARYAGTTPVGVVCFELCASCSGYNDPPTLTLGEAARAAAEHRDHLAVAPTG